jgi:hypothetical protein
VFLLNGDSRTVGMAVALFWDGCVRHARVRFCGTVLSRVGSYSLVWCWPVLDCILDTSYCGPSGSLV